MRSLRVRRSVQHSTRAGKPRYFVYLPEPNFGCVPSAIMPQSSANTTKSSVVVMVVEDEEVIRTMASEFMADAGFEVLEAPDADTAVRLLQTEAERVHVLFTDLRMPGAMDGLMLAHHTRRNWPWIDLVVTSGFVGGVRTIARRCPVFPKTL